MAIPFNLPEEQSDPENLLHRRLTDLYHLLYEILVHRDPVTGSPTLAAESLPTVATNVLDTPFVNYSSESRPCSPTLSPSNDLLGFESLFLSSSAPDLVPFRTRPRCPILTENDAPYYDDERKKNTREYRKNRTPQEQPVPTRPIKQDWKEVGCNLRQIADNFLHNNNVPETIEVESEEYDTGGGGGDLLTTIVSMSPFRDSIWSGVFVVGCRILANAR